MHTLPEMEEEVGFGPAAAAGVAAPVAVAAWAVSAGMEERPSV